MNDIFELKGFESKGPDSILDMDMNFTEDVSVPVPGGLKEQPTAKPYDQSSIPVPSGSTITAAQYNNALTALQKSFKEAADFIGLLSQARVVDKTIEDVQYEYTQEKIDEALLAAYEDGPVFEAVDRSDKKEIKKICKKLRNELKGAMPKGCEFYQPSILARFGNMGKEVDKDGKGTGEKYSWWNTYLWQILGAIVINEGNADDVAKFLTDKFKDELGGFKILALEAPGTINDAFRTHFGKKGKPPYILLVDSKITDELKAVLKDGYKPSKKKKDDDE